MSRKQGSDSAQAAADAKASPRNAPVSGEKSGLFGRLTEFRDYLVLSRAELRKVSWPTWKETRATSMVVLGFVAVMAILLGLVDLVLSSAVRLILS